MNNCVNDRFWQVYDMSIELTVISGYTNDRRGILFYTVLKVIDPAKATSY